MTITQPQPRPEPLEPENPKDKAGTPAWVFRAACDLFGEFDLDVAADFERHVVPRYHARGVLGGGLERPWEAVRAWCNPPYSDVPTWIEKAVTEVRERRSREVIMLVMADTSTRYLHSVLCRDAAGYLLTPRVRFNGHTGSPQFGSIFLRLNIRTCHIASERTISCVDLRPWRERYGRVT